MGTGKTYKTFTINSSIDVPGMPRPKATTIGGMTRMYTPNSKVVNGVKQLIVMEWQKAGRIVLEGPIGVYGYIATERPKRLKWRTKPMPPQLKDTKPDIDNVLKTILDALNNVAFKDDAQVAEISVRKIWAEADDDSHFNLTFAELQPLVESY